MRLLLLALLIGASMMVAGCKEAGDALGSLSGGSSSASGSSSSLSGGSSVVSGLTGGSGTGIDSGGGGIIISHNPEPATVALLGSGLVAYLFLRRRKK